MSLAGCGTASVIWLIYGAVYLVKDHAKYDTSVVVLGYVLLACIVVACASATPCLRFKFHDVFEHLHRYPDLTFLYVSSQRYCSRDCLGSKGSNHLGTGGQWWVGSWSLPVWPDERQEMKAEFWLSRLLWRSMGGTAGNLSCTAGSSQLCATGPKLQFPTWVVQVQRLDFPGGDGCLHCAPVQ